VIIRDEAWTGQPHILTVRSVRLPDGPLDDGALEDYDIRHPRSCKQEKHYLGYWHYTCDIAHDEEECGLSFSLRYSGTPVTEPGVYRIQGWGNKHYSWEYGAWEYDAGTAVIGVIRRLSIVSPLCIDGHEYHRRRRSRAHRGRKGHGGHPL
jgi:hypothetical protein